MPVAGSAGFTLPLAVGAGWVPVAARHDWRSSSSFLVSSGFARLFEFRKGGTSHRRVVRGEVLISLCHESRWLNVCRNGQLLQHADRSAGAIQGLVGLSVIGIGQSQNGQA